MYRNSLSELFCQKGFLKNFAKFTEKHLYWSLFLSKVAGLRWLLLRVAMSFRFRQLQSWDSLLYTYIAGQIHAIYREALLESCILADFLNSFSDISILWTYNCATPHVWKAKNCSPIFILQKQNFKGVLTYLAVLFTKNYWWKL